MYRRVEGAHTISLQHENSLVAALMIGVYVTVFYMVFLFLLFGAFAGYISRVNLDKELDPDEGSLDTLILRGTRETEIEQLLAVRKAERFEIDKQWHELQVKATELLGKHAYESQRRLDLFVPIAAKIAANDNIVSPVFRKEFLEIYRYREEFIAEELGNRLHRILATISYSDNVAIEDLDAFAKEVAIVLNASSEMNLELVRTAGLIEQLSFETASLTSVRNLGPIDAEIARLETELGKIVLKDEQRALIASFKNSLGGTPFFFIQIPTIILTLIVTIAAGGLGSVVAFTRRFWRAHTEVGSGRLFVNVGEGVAAAVAIFLFAGAGMLMLTQGGPSLENEVELSPYLVAFIAFVSGFMAEDAFARVQEAGKSMFGPAKGESIAYAKDEVSESVEGR